MRRIFKVNKHPKRKNNPIVADMYEIYREGKSLAQIGAMYHKTRQAVYDTFRSRGYPLRSKQLKGLQIIDGHRFTEMKGGWLRGTVNGRRIQAHRYVWEKHHGPIPQGYYVKLADGNRRNVAIGNLRLITVEENSSKYNPHLNQFTSPTGSRKSRLSIRARVAAERKERWKRAMAIG